MPGEEQEDIVMTTTQANILNFTCPITGKPVTELEEPVRRYHMIKSRYVFSFTNWQCSFSLWKENKTTVSIPNCGLQWLLQL